MPREPAKRARALVGVVVPVQPGDLRHDDQQIQPEDGDHEIERHEGVVNARHRERQHAAHVGERVGHPACGATVIAAASTDEKLAVCRERGADQTINYERDDLRSVLREIAPAGIDVVVDPVGGAYAEAALRGTKWGGRFVTVGFASGEIPRIPLNLVLLKGVIVKGFEIRTFGGHAPEEAARDRAELNELFASGTLRPHIGATFPLDRTADAIRFVADRKATGKVLIVP